tara:strand:+ start:6357 stop:6722 length:366 start_codon:yes stop_codon:yes gene_type:complete
MTEIKDKRFIRVTGVYGKDNKLKNYKPSAPVNVNVLKIPMPKLDYEFNKGGAVVKKKKTKMMAKGGMAKKTKMMAKGGMAKKKTKMMAKGGKVKKTKMMAKGGKVKGTKMYSKGGKVSKGR